MAIFNASGRRDYFLSHIFPFPPFSDIIWWLLCPASPQLDSAAAFCDAKYVTFYTRWYRFRRWRRDYVRVQDGLNLLAALLMGALATLSYSTHPDATLLLGTVYGVVVLLIFTVAIRTRRARDQVQAEVLRGLFSLINKEIFKADHRTRFTL
jgi:uncharacterized membrane protein YfcA